MSNVLKSVANFLDRAISGKEVDVIELAEKPLEAVSGETPSVASVLGVAGDDAGEAGEAPAVESTEVQDEVETSEDQAEEETIEEEADVETGVVVGFDGGETASVVAVIAAAVADTAIETASVAAVSGDAVAGGETASMPSVLVGVAELEQLRADAGEWLANKDELAQLREWKANGSKPNVLKGAVDAADAVETKTRKVSAQTQAAIDLQEKMEAQAGK